MIQVTLPEATERIEAIAAMLAEAAIEEVVASKSYHCRSRQLGLEVVWQIAQQSVDRLETLTRR